MTGVEPAITTAPDRVTTPHRSHLDIGAGNRTQTCGGISPAAYKAVPIVAMGLQLIILSPRNQRT